MKQVKEALERVLLDIEFMWEDGTLPDRRDDIIYANARAALAALEAAPTDDVVERVAKVLRDHDNPGCDWAEYIEDARAAIAAMGGK